MFNYKEDLMSKLGLCLIFLVTLMIITISSVTAQTPELTNGLSYLQSTQSPEGYWGDVSEVPYNSFVDTSTVVETLNYLNESETAYDSAIQWINSTEVSNDDYLFKKMLVLSQAGFDVSTIRDYLLSVINDDNGWGVAEGFESDVKRTALALQALKAINYPDLETISYALFYLTYNQNTDGGFGFYLEDSSNVYMTALVLKVLSLYNDTFDLQAEIDSAVAYILTMQNIDGSFGEGTVYESALAFEALITTSPSTSSGQELQNAIDYLINNQQPNGSWDNDPYSTALALRALASVKPNLTISSSDITFSNQTPTVGETVTITATIHNTGIAQVDNITVAFYDGDPDAGGILIRETGV